MSLPIISLHPIFEVRNWQVYARDTLPLLAPDDRQLGSTLKIYLRLKAHRIVTQLYFCVYLKTMMEFLELWLAIVAFFAVSIWVFRHYHIRPLLRRIKDQVSECLSNFEHSIKPEKVKFLQFLSRNLSTAFSKECG